MAPQLLNHVAILVQRLNLQHCSAPRLMRQKWRTGQAAAAAGRGARFRPELQLTGL